MGNNLSFELDEPLPKINYNVRWLYSKNQNSNATHKTYYPFSLDISIKIEQAYEKNQIYDSPNDNIIILFDYEHQQNHVLVDRNDVWNHKRIKREHITTSLLNKAQKYSIFTERITSDVYFEEIVKLDEFSKAFVSQLRMCPYNKIFDGISFEKRDPFMDDFMKSYLIIEEGQFQYLQDVYLELIYEKFKVGIRGIGLLGQEEGYLKFEKIKDGLIEDLTSINNKELFTYIKLYLKGLTRENFVSNIIKMFNEDGVLYKMVLNMIKKKMFKSNEKLILYYLCLMFALNKHKLNTLNEKMYIYHNNTNSKIKFKANTYYYISEFVICSRNELINFHDNYQKIEIDFNYKALSPPMFSFLYFLPYNNGEVYNIFKHGEITLPPNTILKCISTSGDRIKFEIVYDVLSNYVNVMNDKDKKKFYIYDDVAEVSNSILISAKEVVPNIKYSKVKQRTVNNTQKYIQYTNSLESFDCFGCQIDNDENLRILCSIFQNKKVKNYLKYWNLSGNELRTKGIIEINKCLPFLSKTLVFLDLSFNVINDEALEKINFKFLPNLRYLILKENQITEKGAELLAKSFRYIKQLLVLDLYDNKIQNEGICHISNEIKELQQLIKIDLYHCFIKDDGVMVFLTNILVLDKSIQWINLKQNLFGKKRETIDCIIKVINSFHYLNFFNLEQNELSDIDYNEIEMKTNYKLRNQFMLDDNKISTMSLNNERKTLNHGFNVIPEIKIKSISSLNFLINNINEYYSNYITSIDFSELNQDIDKELLKKFLHQSPNLLSLKTINLNFCKELSLNSLDAILSSLNNYPHLTELYLSYIDLDQKLDIFKKNMNQFSHLEKLELCFNSINEYFIVETIPNFSFLVSLKHLDLYSNLIGDRGLEILCICFKLKNSITYLNVGKNLIGNEGAVFLSDSLKYLQNLKWLDMSLNFIDDKGLNKILNNYTLIISLDRFDIRNNKFSQKIQEMMLEQGIPSSFMI